MLVTSSDKIVGVELLDPKICTFKTLMCDAWLIVKLRWCGALIPSLCKPVFVQLVTLLLREGLWESLLHMKEVLLTGLDEVAMCVSRLRVFFICGCQAGGLEALLLGFLMIVVHKISFLL